MWRLWDYGRANIYCDKSQFEMYRAYVGPDDTSLVVADASRTEDNLKTILDMKLRLLLKMLSEKPEISVTNFQPNERKADTHI